MPIINHMVDYKSATDAVFKALSDPTRRAMLVELKAGPRTVSALAEPHSMSLAAASKHVAVLERAGLAHRRKEGRTHHITLAPQGLKVAADWLAAYSTFWSGRLDALEAALSEEGDET
jgi:DNA-binding transcriptional ArsR family regulator